MTESQLSASHLDMARSWLVRNGSVLFCGMPAAVDDTVVDDLVRGVDGRRVLDCRSRHVDADGPLAALISLFSSVDEREAAGLPQEYRRILADAIFRPVPRAPSVALLGPAVLGLLRLLSRATPLLLVPGAVHGLDRETRRVLQFVAERVDGLPIHMVAVEDVRGLPTPEGHRLCPPPLVMVWLSQPPDPLLN